MLQFMQCNINHCNALKEETYRLAKEFGYWGLTKEGSRHRSVSSHRYVFFSYCTNFLNNYRYHDNTRGWQGRYGRQYQHHATSQPQAHHHLRRVGSHLWHFRKVLNTTNQSSIPLFWQSQLSSYDHSFQPGLKTGCWSSRELYLCLAWISTISYLFLSSTVSIVWLWLIHDCYFLP